MTISDAQFTAWLKDQSAARCVLVEADVKLATGSVETRFLSNKTYVTGGADTPANTIYSARITGGIKFTRSLSLEGQASLSFGDIELLNTDGSLDSWLDDYWVNRQVRVFVGDVSWARADFRLVFAGVMTGIDSRKRDRVNIKLSDILQRLNTPVTEEKLGGSGNLADTLLPLCFGECHNVTPVLVDSTVNEYMVHDGPIESIIEVRDNGVPVLYTATLTTGRFTLTAAPAGVITCSVQGAKFPLTVGGADEYSNNIVDIIRRLSTAYGSQSQRLAELDLDSTSVVQFKTSHPQPVGIYLVDRQNVLDVCNKLAASVGGRLYVTTSGKVGLVELHLPQASTGTPIKSVDFVVRSIEVKQLAPVVAAVKLGYCKNWTVQAGLSTGIVPEHVAMYAEEWLTQTVTDSSAAANYNLFTDPVMAESHLLTAFDAITEANRRLAMFSTQRKVIKYTGFYHLLFETLGASQTITHPRFGLVSGKTGQIISISVDLLSPHVDFEVLI